MALIEDSAFAILVGCHCRDVKHVNPRGCMTGGWINAHDDLFNGGRAILSRARLARMWKDRDKAENAATLLVMLWPNLLGLVNVRRIVKVCGDWTAS